MTVKASSCEQNCDTGSGIRFKKDKYYAEDMYYLNGEFELQCEIMKNGPIMSSTYVNSGELYGYKSGIYKVGFTFKVMSLVVDYFSKSMIINMTLFNS
jgi:hypothetical protein